jgi:hypothetical protein
LNGSPTPKPPDARLLRGFKEAYVSEEKLPDQKIASGHTRKELQQRDPALYIFIQKLAQVEQ